MNVTAIDIGGTHARFAPAHVSCGKVVALGDAEIYRTADFAGLETAWQTYAQRRSGQATRRAAIAVASPIDGALIKLTNNPWTIRPSELRERMDLHALTLVNDFVAVAHAAAQLGPDSLSPVCGPTGDGVPAGVVSICGPGTGLGVATVLRSGGSYQVIESEGGHVDFSPLDEIDDRILHHLRQRHVRVSAERVVSGPGIAAIYEVLSAIEKRPLPQPLADRDIWSRALDGSDPLAVAALERLCMSLGAFAGDLALTQGAKAVIVAGGVGLRLREQLPRSGFVERFVAKGRFRTVMERLPVWLMVHPQPGLYGAAAAFANEHG